MFFGSRKNAWRTGDAPPVGGYFCAICCSDYSYIAIRRKGQTLPHCPVCGGEEWMRV